ncbi:class I SAM-dependent methyltransferase [Alkalicoccus halolimnae]|uniref:Class I SAM-dependent methyltransferase n=1 Tax=Alkalicoccus halolimnae TaxID=1667239 RepID=A0A5C7FAI3_9BACI|nr:class I SAM-dependent methyltransferase [Alkalicoccus halolimnae]TXF83075.1 class I SAM-dependent methyltransferase [Alkalicoccus halolimnae]
MSELQRVIQARNWMKTNENFLETWHAHVGYDMDLFDSFEKGASVKEVSSSRNLSEELLERWVDVGLQVGHLTKKKKEKVKAKKKMVRYASKASRESVGILLSEMMELHIPTLLKYPDLIRSDERLTYLSDKFAEIVAETSTFLEKAAVSPILKWVKQENPASIIDFGCGYCGYLSAVHNKYPETELIGVELSREVVEKAKARVSQDIDVRQGDIEDFLESFEGKTDMIMAHNLLYYFKPEERVTLFRKFAGALTKKGSVTIICPLVYAKHGGAFTTAFNTFMSAHDNLYPLPSPETIKKDAGNSGFHVAGMKPLIREGGWYLITLKKNS